MTEKQVTLIVLILPFRIFFSHKNIVHVGRVFMTSWLYPFIDASEVKKWCNTFRIPQCNRKFLFFTRKQFHTKNFEEFLEIPKK